MIRFVTGTLAILVLSAAVGLGSAAVRRLPFVPNVEAIQKSEQTQSWLRAHAGLTLAEFKEHYESGGLVIDARSPEEFAKGHLDAPLILNIPPDDLAGRGDILMSFLGQPIVLYCTSNECDLAEQLWEGLEAYGLTAQTIPPAARIYFPGWQDGILPNNLPTRQGATTLFDEEMTGDADEIGEYEPGTGDGGR